jgi:hypothetical protein
MLGVALNSQALLCSLLLHTETESNNEVYLEMCLQLTSIG